MGDPNVFECGLNHGFIGFGIHPTIHRCSEYGKTLDIFISFPFFYIDIFCRKTKENNWF